MKSIVGLILGVVGGLGSICLSILLFFLFVAVRMGRSVMEEGETTTLINFASNLSIGLFFFVIWFLVIGILGLVFSSMMNKENKVVKGSVWCIICGVLGLNPFLIIGGAMGLISYNSYDGVIIED